MATITVKKKTIKKKDSSDQKKLHLKRVAINNSVNKLTSAARNK